MHPAEVPGRAKTNYIPLVLRPLAEMGITLAIRMNPNGPRGPLWGSREKKMTPKVFLWESKEIQMVPKVYLREFKGIQINPAGIPGTGKDVDIS